MVLKAQSELNPIRQFCIQARNCNSKLSHQKKEYVDHNNSLKTKKNKIRISYHSLKKKLDVSLTPGSWRNNDQSPCSLIQNKDIKNIILSYPRLYKYCNWITKNENRSSALCLPLYERFKASKSITSPRPVCQGGKYDYVAVIGERIQELTSENLKVNSSLLKSNFTAPQNIKQILQFSIKSRNPKNPETYLDLLKKLELIQNNSINLFCRIKPIIKDSWDLRISTGKRDDIGLGGDLKKIYSILAIKSPKNLQDFNHQIPSLVFTFKTGETCLLII